MNRDLAIVVSSGTLKGVIVVDMETGMTHTSLGKKRVIEPGKTGNSEVLIIRPDVDLKSIGVDYLKASEEGVIRAYRKGYVDGMSVEISGAELR